MGSYSLLQIVGSTIIGGLLLLMLFRYNAVVSEKNHRYNTQKIVRKNLMNITKVINADLNKIGFCLNDKKADIIKNPIVEAKETSFAFKTDVPVDKNNLLGDGNPDIVKYYLGGDVTETPNANDKHLYRTVNGGAQLDLGFGITKLKFTYYNSNGDSLNLPISTSNLEKIKMIEYTITVEDIYGYSYTYNIDAGERKQGDYYFLTMSKTNKFSIKNLRKR